MFVYTNIGHFPGKNVIMAEVVFACSSGVTMALPAVDLLIFTEIHGMSTLEV